MDCQLQNLPEAGSEPTRGEQLRAAGPAQALPSGGRAALAVREPRRCWRRPTWWPGGSGPGSAAAPTR